MTEKGHMPVVYSTGVSEQIRRAYNHYQYVKNLGDKTATMAAYIKFANACEKENKHPNAVVETINS